MVTVASYRAAFARPTPTAPGFDVPDDGTSIGCDPLPEPSMVDGLVAVTRKAWLSPTACNDDGDRSIP